MPLEQNPDTKELVIKPVAEEETVVAEEKVEEKKPDYPWWDMTQGRAGTAFESIKSFAGKVKEGNVTGSDYGDLFGSLLHLQAELSVPEALQSTYTLGSIKAISNAVRAVTDMREGEYTDYAIGRGADEAEEAAYKVGGYKPPSEMSDGTVYRNFDVPFIDVPFIDGQVSEKMGDEFRASLMLNAWLAAAQIPVGSLLSATKIPFITKIVQGLDPTKANTFMGALGRLSTINAIDEIGSTYLDDNRGVNLFGLGAKPGMTRTEASNAAFLPNLLMSGTFGLGLNFIPLKQFFANKTPQQVAKELFPQTLRAKKSESLQTPLRIAKEQEIADGIITEDAGGNVAFTKNVDPDGANAEKITPGTPESTAVHSTLENLDDTQIAEIGQVDKDIPRVIEEVSKRSGDGDQQLLKFDDVSAPSQSLAITDVDTRINQIPTDNLLSIANPKNGTTLFDAIQDATGKDFEEFTRIDVVNGIKKLAGEGRTLMPNRLMGMPYRNVNEIKLDPVRFQYKGGVDAEGVQKGQSLEGVEKWNNDLEGVVQVWEDPKDELVYVVNGHNRLAKAKELGIPSVKVEYLDAPDAISARQQGALTNIAQGGGTTFDAANFFKESEITSPEQLTDIGVPLKSGLGAKGLALSKLPPNIYQDVLDGKITQNRGFLLGSSGLDEVGMQTAYKVLQKKDVTDATFSEVLQQAKNAPTAEGGQVDLFGNTEMLNLMIEKGQLAASIKRNLVQDRNLFRRAGSGADRLEAAGSKIDRFEAANQKNFADAAIAQFDAEKYADTNISKLLNEGAEQISQGAKVGVVTRRIQPKIINEILDNPVVPTKTPEIQTELPTSTDLPDRRVMINNIIKKAAQNGEVRPPTTPLINTPKATNVNATKVINNLRDGKVDGDSIRLMADELRLADEHKALDEAINADRIAQKRAEMGWDNMTYEQKKQRDFFKQMEMGNRKFEFDMITDPINKLRKQVPTMSVDQLKAKKLELEQGGYPLTKRVKDNIARKRTQFPYVFTKKKTEKMRMELVSDANIKKLYKDGEQIGDELFEAELKKITDLEDKAHSSVDIRLVGQAEYELVVNELNKKTAKTTGFTLPNEFARMKPRYGLGEIDFDSDLDRVAYIIRSKAKKSKREDDIVAILKQQGVDPDKARAHGSKVHQFVKDYVREETGSAAASNAAGMTIKVPDQGFFDAPKMSFASDIDFTDGAYNDTTVRRILETYKQRLKINEMDQLADYGRRIADDAESILMQSKGLAYEANKALKQAIIISGIEPNKVKFLDEINMHKMFSYEDNVQATAQWRPDIATFMARNPQDPLSSMDVGQTSAMFVPPEYRSAMRGSIYLSLNANLRRRLGGELSGVSKDGRRFLTDAAHESFHAVQNMLSKFGDPRLANALEQPEAIKEMISIIKRNKGNLQPGMNNKEIQAEAFGQWLTNRSINLENGGLKAAFERVKKYINVFGRELRRILKKDPSYVDVFELAASGAIARKSKVNKLTPVQLESLIGKMDAELDRNIPELTQRINNYLITKKIEYENMLNGWNDSVAKGGCL